MAAAQPSTSKKRLRPHQHKKTDDTQGPKRLISNCTTTARRGISDDADIVLETHQVDEARRDDNEHIALLKLKGTINGLPATLLVDSGASANFIDTAFVDQHKTHMPTTAGEARLISLADGSTHRSDQRLKDADLIVGTHQETQQFTVLPLKGQTAILGLPWLSKNDANIDWRKRRIWLKTDGRVHTLCMLGDIRTTSATVQSNRIEELHMCSDITPPSSDSTTRHAEASCNSTVAATRHSSNQ